MKKIKNIALGLVILVFVGIISSYFLYNFKISAVSNNDEIKIIEIKSGYTTYDIGKTLYENDLIKSELFFKIYLRLNSINTLQAGFYELSEDMGVDTIVKQISSGDAINPDAFNITFQEGKNIKGIVKIISEETNNTSEEIYTILNNEEYLDEKIKEYWFLTSDIKNEGIYYALEGYLFPETYTFSNKDVTAEAIIDYMLSQTNKILTKYKTDIEKSDYNINEILTLASIIELEGVSDKDRGAISGVFYNRLNINMSLGSDVTTYYGVQLEMSERDLKQSELDDINPYNTRLDSMAGKLPIGPICNAGEESIKAAITPEENDYLYFVADKNKNVIFTKTYAEHQQAIIDIKAAGNWIEW